ncbi:MAG: zf-HC2 domain-containing protein [Acidobacteriia bacterium]|nr:zf-HC2 domain-containing protein [Terriglobia bacterium]
MKEHDAIRELLPLAAAEALEEKEQRRIEEHLPACAACTAELERWRALGRGLKRLPTPPAPALLVERTRQQMQVQLAAAAERATKPWVLGFLVALSWTLVAATWPLLRLLAAVVAGWLDPGFRSLWMGVASYTLAGWAAGGLAAIALGWRRAAARRTA